MAGTVRLSLPLWEKLKAQAMDSRLRGNDKIADCEQIGTVQTYGGGFLRQGDAIVISLQQRVPSG